MRGPMRRSDFHYDLPDDLIAAHPARGAATAGCCNSFGGTGAMADRRFVDLPGLLRAGDLLVFNDTRVIPARLRGRKESGGESRSCSSG